MKDFRSLQIWQRGHQLVLKIYQITNSFPKEELYGLTSQLRRASVSIPTNIAEGCGRDGDAELRRFLQIAMGSASETEYLLTLSYELQFIDNLRFEGLEKEIVELKRMLTGFILKLKADNQRLLADR